MAKFDGILKKVSEFNNALLSDPVNFLLQHLVISCSSALSLALYANLISFEKFAITITVVLNVDCVVIFPERLFSLHMPDFDLLNSSCRRNNIYR